MNEELGKIQNSEFGIQDLEFRMKMKGILREGGEL